MDKTIRVPDPVDLTQYRINVGDTTEFVAKFNQTQSDVETLSDQLGDFSEDITRIAGGIEAEASRAEKLSRQNLQPVFSDVYGTAAFFDDAGLVSVSGAEFAVAGGSAVVGGIQVEIPAVTLPAAEGDFIQCSVAWNVDAAGVFSIAVNIFADPIEQQSQDALFYVSLAEVIAGPALTDMRVVLLPASDVVREVGAMTGACVGFPATKAPLGWLKANGASLSRIVHKRLWEFAKASGNLISQALKDSNPLLYGAAFGDGDGVTTFTIPDRRGRFERNWDDGRGIDLGRSISETQEGMIESHGHDASSSVAGSHAHAGSADSGGDHSHSASASSGGSHAHGISWQSNSYVLRSSPDVEDFIGSGNNDSASGAVPSSTNSGGAHSHTISVGSGGDHGHSLTINAEGDHSHAITVQAAGGVETRPGNSALLMCIKY
ncbi:phage tail protein [Oceanospirillum sp. HFRX-1_2]